jgi:hypothetical protein
MRFPCIMYLRFYLAICVIRIILDIQPPPPPPSPDDDPKDPSSKTMDSYYIQGWTRLSLHIQTYRIILLLTVNL